MSKIELLEPFLEEGIHNTNFFNGRLLSAEDMQREQAANRLQRQQLGQAIGDGVAHGLEVRKNRADTSGVIVSVSAGMAINRLGQALSLPADTDVALVRQKEVVAADAGLFSPCRTPVATDLISPTGVYILVISPASGYEGQAPASGVVAGDLSARGGCRRRDTVEGVQFRLVGVKLESLPDISAETISDITRCATAIESGTEKPKNLSLLRNLLAHLCFGTAELAGFVRDPFRKADSTSPFSSYGIVDALRSGNTPALTDCDVPLGLIYWTKAGIQFVDQWSVRRRVATRQFSTPWPFLFGERRQAEAEAMFEQFQEHLNQLQTDSSALQVAQITAAGWFRYLPPAGMIPVNSGYIVRYMQDSGAASLNVTAPSSGLDPAIFLKGAALRKPAYINAAQTPAIFCDSRPYPPIDLTGSDFIFLYLVRENIETLEQSAHPQPYIIFTSGHLPYFGNARFDLARFDFSNYAFV
jgi:hypothetical protein